MMQRRQLTALIMSAGLALAIPACGQAGQHTSPARSTTRRAGFNPGGVPNSTRVHTRRRTALKLAGDAVHQVAGLTANFVAERTRVNRMLAPENQLSRRQVPAVCGAQLRRAGENDAFSVQVLSVLILQARALKAPYISFSRGLQAIALTGALRRAAGDSVAVRAQLADLAEADADPCAIASQWQTHNWSNNWPAVYAPALANRSLQERLSKDGAAAVRQLEAAGISVVVAQDFATAVDPLQTT
jgi:hypothetical protein